MESEKKDHRRIFKRIIVGLTAVVLVVTGAWGVTKLVSTGVFAPVDIQESTSATVAATTTSATPTVLPTSTPTTSPSPTPTPTPTPTPSPEQLEDLAMQEKLSLAPSLDGAVKVIKEINGLKRVTYEAVPGNPYGIKAGQYVGEYKNEISLEGNKIDNKIGGVALVPKVVEKLLSINQNLIVIPVDISEINDKTKIELLILLELRDGNGIIFENCFIKINTNEKVVSISNIIIDSEITNQSFSGGTVLPSYCRVGITPIKKTDKYYPSIYGDFNNSKVFQGKALLGQKIAETDKRIGLFYVNIFGLKTIEDNDFLKVGGCIVFLIDGN